MRKGEMKTKKIVTNRFSFCRPPGESFAAILYIFNCIVHCSRAYLFVAPFLPSLFFSRSTFRYMLEMRDTSRRVENTKPSANAYALSPSLFRPSSTMSEQYLAQWQHHHHTSSTWMRAAAMVRRASFVKANGHNNHHKINQLLICTFQPKTTFLHGQPEPHFKHWSRTEWQRASDPWTRRDARRCGRVCGVNCECVCVMEFPSPHSFALLLLFSNQYSYRTI